MIYLHTLEDSFIRVGEKDIRPTAPMLFAALLYLCIERGHRVSRTALQEMLFPSAGERSGAHSLRQLLYKLRQLGVPLEADTATVLLPANAVQEGSGGTNGSGDADRVSEPLLEGYAPNISPAFDRWLDERRSTHVASARAVAVSALSHARESGNYRRTEHAASALLKLDPLNEEATLARAEAMALGGQKHDAVKLLEEYSAEVGAVSPTLRVAADVLRRRITDRLVLRERSSVPMVGREDELALLLAHFARACAGQPTVSIVWGDAGIGKTRLVQEFSANVALRSARLEMTHCQPHDVGRPLGALIDLVPKLLLARGALGVSPESLSQLRRLSGERTEGNGSYQDNAALVAARIREALQDLLGCVAEEHPLVVVIEDSHWLDEASLRFSLTNVPTLNSRVHLILTQRGQPPLSGVSLSEHFFVRHLEPLASTASADLLNQALRGEAIIDADTRHQCLTLGAGNPLFLCTIAAHLLRGEVAPSSSFGISDLLRQRVRLLDARALLLLRIIAALGKHASSARIASCIETTTEALLLALQDLSDKGLVVRQEGGLRCLHDSLAEVVLIDSPPSIGVAIYERVASVLEKDGTSGKQVNLLWSCAESWRLADNPQRAATALRKCASFALEIGQPAFAYSALARAQGLADEREMLELLEESIWAADVANDSDAVMATVDRYRVLRKQRGLDPNANTACELAEINAWRRQNRAVWEHNARLRNCVMDTTSSPILRLRAARIFLYVAEQQLEKAIAVEFFDNLDAGVLGKSAPADWLHFRMMFHCSFGDMLQAKADADRLRDFCRTNAHAYSSITISNIGSVLFKSGDIGAGFDALHLAIEGEERLRLASSLINDCARITSYYFAVGDYKSAHTWHLRTHAHVLATGRQHVPPYLANCVDFALLEGDHSRARQHLTLLLTEYQEATTPYNRRLATGYDLQIRILDRTLSEADLVPARSQHEQGREFSEHDILAAGLANALSALGNSAEAALLLSDYLSKWRRDRYPMHASSLLVGSAT